MKGYLCLLSLSAVLTLPSHAITDVFIFNSGIPGGGFIPDGDPTGIADLRTIATTITSIDDISVSLNIDGSWNGDIYATLQHESGFAVLLNRVGRTAGNSFGYSDNGFDVTFNDSGAFDDVHVYQDFVGSQNPLLGTWGSDGREVDPSLVVDTDARSALLTSFVGLDPNGEWTLLVADMAGGDAHFLNSWSLVITGTEGGGTPVPSGGSSALMLAFGLVGLAGFRRVGRRSSAAS